MAMCRAGAVTATLGFVTRVRRRAGLASFSVICILLILIEGGWPALE
jgi:hypothetical protein